MYVIHHSWKAVKCKKAVKINEGARKEQSQWEGAMRTLAVDDLYNIKHFDLQVNITDINRITVN